MATKTKKTKTATQATWRAKLKSYQEWKEHILAQWAEHNTFHVEKQEDGGFRVRLPRAYRRGRQADGGACGVLRPRQGHRDSEDGRGNFD